MKIDLEHTTTVNLEHATSDIGTIFSEAAYSILHFAETTPIWCVFCGDYSDLVCPSRELFLISIILDDIDLQ